MSLDVALPVNSLHNVRALAYSVYSDFIYWIDAARTKSIRRARDDGTQVCLFVFSFFTFYCLFVLGITMLCMELPHLIDVISDVAFCRGASVQYYDRGLWCTIVAYISIQLSGLLVEVLKAPIQDAEGDKE